MAFTAGSPEFRRALDNLLDDAWDVVVVDHLQSGWAIDVLAERLDRSVVVVHISQNNEANVRARVASGTADNLASRIVLELDARKVRKLEQRIVESVDLVTAITEEDAATLASPNSLVLPPGYDGVTIEAREITAAVPRRAVVAGSLAWRVKQHDLLRLLQVADERFAAADAEIVIAGNAPLDFVARVRESTKATRMLGHVDTFDDVFSSTRLALISEPNGGGFKLKALDYVFHRVPMLVEAGSVAGLPLANGDGLLEFPDVDALVNGALDALDDFETLNRLHTEAFEQCRSAFDWSERAAQLTDATRHLRARRS
jgi:glycosyltransferase involved in cell wall biosynthesis